MVSLSDTATAQTYMNLSIYRSEPLFLKQRSAGRCVASPCGRWVLETAPVHNCTSKIKSKKRFSSCDTLWMRVLIYKSFRCWNEVVHSRRTSGWVSEHLMSSGEFFSSSQCCYLLNCWWVKTSPSSLMGKQTSQLATMFWILKSRNRAGKPSFCTTRAYFRAASRDCSSLNTKVSNTNGRHRSLEWLIGN